MNLVETAQDHKNTIYCQLNVKDLIQLGKVCKVFYQDKNRIQILVDKIADEHFYRDILRNKYGFTIPIEMPNLNQHIEWIKRTGNEENFREKYVKNMLQLDYRFCRNQHTQLICFVPEYFLSLSLETKTKIIDRVSQNIFELWQYAEDKNQDMNYYFGKPLDENEVDQDKQDEERDVLEREEQKKEQELEFDYYIYYRSLENILKIIFQRDSNEMKQIIWDSLEDLSEKTKNSKPDLIRNFDHYYRLFRNTNQISKLYFIAFLDHLTFYDLEPILKIGDFLEANIKNRYDDIYLYHYLLERMESFLQSDRWVKESHIMLLKIRLNESYDETRTNKDRLYQLFRACHLDVNEFEECLENSVRDEDYDY